MWPLKLGGASLQRVRAGRSSASRRPTQGTARAMCAPAPLQRLELRLCPSEWHCDNWIVHLWHHCPWLTVVNYNKNFSVDPYLPPQWCGCCSGTRVPIYSHTKNFSARVFGFTERCTIAVDCNSSDYGSVSSPATDRNLQATDDLPRFLGHLEGGLHSLYWTEMYAWQTAGEGTTCYTIYVRALNRGLLSTAQVVVVGGVRLTQAFHSYWHTYYNDPVAWGD